MTILRARMDFISVFVFLLLLTPEVTCVEPDIRDMLQNIQNLLVKNNDRYEAKLGNTSSELQKNGKKAQNKSEDLGVSKTDQLLSELKKGLAVEKQSRVILEETVDQLKRRFLAGEFRNLDQPGTDVLMKSLQAFNRSLERERIRGVNLEVKVQQLENRQKAANKDLEAERARSAQLEVKVQQVENRQKAVSDELNTEKTNRMKLEMSAQQMNNTLLRLKNGIPANLSKIIEKMMMLKAGGAEKSPGRTNVTTSPLKVSTGPVLCPSGWSAFSDSCYYFKLSSEKLSSFEAGEKCKEKHAGSTLVSIETADEFNFLKNTLKSHHGSVKRYKSGWMTSGKKVDGHWEWSTTGERLKPSAVKWRKGRPIHLKCLSLWPPSFDISDVYCTAYDRHFICELPLRNA